MTSTLLCTLLSLYFLLKLIQILQDAASQSEESAALIQSSVSVEHVAENVGDDEKHVLKSDPVDFNGLDNK